MVKSEKVFLVPEYMTNFTCIGSECEDTCCKGWTITIDKKTFKKYRNLKDKELSPLTDTYLKRTRNNVTESNYATIRMDENNACPFLNCENLCSLHAKKGADYLSNVCNTYPRINNIVNDSLEQSASVSCPEAARKALLNPGLMVFKQVTLEHSQNYNIGYTFNPFPTQGATDYFWELRVFTIEVIQNRKYPLSKRLLLLGIFYENLQNLIDEDRFSEIPHFIDSYRSLIETEQLNESISAIPVSYDLQLQIVKHMVDLRMEIGVTNQNYLECVEDTMKGIQYEDGKDFSQVLASYQLACDEHFIPFMRNHEYVLENYLVNYVFKNLFPFYSGHQQVFHDFFLLILHYSMIKLHLIGIAGLYKDNFSLDHVIKCIYSFSRVVEHTPIYLIKVAQLMKERGHNSLAHVAILVEN